jgi:CheY-like chemotaxis protein
MANILVIDDDREFRIYVAAILRRAGHEVLLESSSRIFANAVQSASLRAEFDIAIVDILMPNVSGIDVIRLLKQTRPNAGIIAMSGGEYQAGIQARLDLAAEHGAKELLMKPFSAAELRRMIDRSLSRLEFRNFARPQLAVQNQPQ